MEGKSLNVTNAMWARQAIVAYLHGEHSLSWILGVIQASGDVEAARQFNELGGSGDPERHEDIRRRLEAEAA